MAKYHIGESGLPRKCNAIKRQCPLGKHTPHFETYAEAAKYSSSLLEETFSGEMFDSDRAVAGSREIDYPLMEVFGGKSKVHRTTNESDVKMVLEGYYPKGIPNGGQGSPGERTEIGVACAYARELGCTNVAIVREDGTVIGDTFIAKVSIEKVNGAVRDSLDKMKAKSMKSNVVRSVFYSDSGDTIVAHMGDSNTLDIAIIDKGKVEIVEVKDLSTPGGAQTNSTPLSADEDGRLIGPSERITSDTLNAISKAGGVKTTIGENIPLNLTHDQSAINLISAYRGKGATKFTFLNKEHKMIEIDLTDSDEAVANALSDHSIQSTMRLRSNRTAKVPQPKDLIRLKKKRGVYFASGEFPEDEFTLRDVAKEHRNLEENPTCAGYLTIGELVLPVRKGKVGEVTLDTKFKVRDLKIREVTLLGDIVDKTNDSNENKKAQYASLKVNWNKEHGIGV